MKTYKNKNFKKRDYESVNVVFLQSSYPTLEHWIECNEDEISKMNCTKLYSASGDTFFGYM